MGLVIWVVTQSALSLLFAALGPLIAIASLLDGRMQSRRTASREAARFDRELAAARDELRTAHDEERRMLERESPSAVDLVAREPAARVSSPTARIGRGKRDSRVAVEGAPPVTRSDSRERGLLDQFLVEAATLAAAPVTVDVSGGVGIVGVTAAARALYRSLTLQLAAALPPDAWSLAVGPDAEAWISALPHRARVAHEPGIAFESSAEAIIRLALVARPVDLPADCEVVVTDHENGATVEWENVRVRVDELERVSAAQALTWAVRCAAEARESGVVEGRSALDASVDFATLDHESEGAAIGHDGAGQVVVDLVDDGPHAVIGGTTGSGKSELLITWVLALAMNHPPERMSFLLVDFKGGATFGTIAHLPHCVGLLTDLDAATAERAFESLAAEVRYREAHLARQGARDIADAEGLARLVIAVDEFAALATASPHLHALFADLAARGRSLGIHLILCTQRPAGVVRDAVLANVGVRISLRVHDRADSLAIIGIPDAAALPAHPRGRAYLASGGAPPRLLQLALAAPSDIGVVAERWRDAALPRQPWCQPLATEIPLAALPRVEGAITLGRADHPHEQSQPVAHWTPATDGSLLVVGAARSGTSTALETIAAGAPDVQFVRGDPLATWDVVTRTLAEVRAGQGRATLVVVDDLDVSLDRLGHEHAAALMECLQSLLREGPAAGIHCAISVHRIAATVQPLLALCGSRLLLRLADRQEHVFAGGRSQDFLEDAPPGRGTWRGRAMQVANGADAVEHVRADTSLVSEPFVAVAANPQAFIQRARLAGICAERLDASALTVSTGAPRVLVGDPDEWQSHWGALPRLRETLPLVVDGCSLAEYRAVSRQRDLPPPLSGIAGELWCLDPHGTARRAILRRAQPHTEAIAPDSAQNRPLDPLI